MIKHWLHLLNSSKQRRAGRVAIDTSGHYAAYILYYVLTVGDYIHKLAL